LTRIIANATDDICQAKQLQHKLAGEGRVPVQFFERRQTGAIFNFSLRGKHCFPYLQDHGPWASDLRYVELSFFDFGCQLDSAQCYFRNY
jgi:hypothetical protein